MRVAVAATDTAGVAARQPRPGDDPDQRWLLTADAVGGQREDHRRGDREAAAAGRRSNATTWVS